jgi:hypothetical protein
MTKLPRGWRVISAGNYPPSFPYHVAIAPGWPRAGEAARQVWGFGWDYAAALKDAIRSLRVRRAR